MGKRVPRHVPLLYDDEVILVGEPSLHSGSRFIIGLGLLQHVMKYELPVRLFQFLNMYYPPPPGVKTDRAPNVAPDHMIVEMEWKQNEFLDSYVIGRDGPAPRTVIEVLSPATALELDLGPKPLVYAYLGVREYIQVDVAGEFLPERLLLKRLQPNGAWKNEQDADGGVTSDLGFRLLIEADGQLRVTDLKGYSYIRPTEVRRMTRERRQVDERTGMFHDDRHDH